MKVNYSLAVIVFLVCFFVRFILITSQLGFDEGTFLAEGYMMAHNHYLLYAHNTNKPPLAFLIPHFFSYFFGGLELVLYLRLASCLVYSLTAFLVCVLTQKLFNHLTGLFVGFVFSLYFTGVFTFGYSYLIYVMLIQFALAVSIVKKRFLFSGVLFALGCWFIQFSVFMLPVVLYSIYYAKRRREALKDFAFGVVLLCVVVLPYLLAYSDVSNLWFSVFSRNSRSDGYDISTLSEKLSLFWSLFNDNMLLFAIIFFGGLYALIFRKRVHPIVSLSSVWIMSILVGFLVLGHIWWAYVMYLFVPASIILGLVISKIRNILIMILVFSVIVSTLVFSVNLTVKENFNAGSLAEDYAMAMHFSSCKNLYLVGNEGMYVLSGVMPPQSQINKYTLIFPDGYTLYVRDRDFLSYNSLSSMAYDTDCVALSRPGVSDNLVVNNLLLKSVLRSKFHYLMYFKEGREHGVLYTKEVL